MSDKTHKKSETEKVCPTESNPITGEVHSLIEAVACETIRFSGFRKADIEDLCQVYSMAVLDAFPRYDNSKQDYLTYVRGVLYRTKKNLYRTRIRRGKDSLVVSLDSIPQNDPCFIDSNILTPDVELERKERIEQINRVYESLDPVQQKVCILLMRNASNLEIMQVLDITKWQLYENILPEIRRKFRKIRRNP